MSSAIYFVIPSIVVVFLFGFLIAFILIWRRFRGKFWKNRRREPTATQLRKMKIPVIESTPFWVPGKVGDLVGIEIQPSTHHLMPITYSTPKPRRKPVGPEVVPQLKFSIQYHKASGHLEVQLLDTANLQITDSGSEFSDQDSSVFLFANVQLTQQEDTKKRLRLMSRRRRRRHQSFEIEMTYEELQLQTLQFCVMGYDEYSRQKVIGDVLLPLAELAQQGVDITRELVMWRDIQSSQPRSSVAGVSGDRLSHLSAIEKQRLEGRFPNREKVQERKCSAS